MQPDRPVARFRFPVQSNEEAPGPRRSAPPVYRPGNTIAPKRLPPRAAPPVYRPTARPVQMTPVSVQLNEEAPGPRRSAPPVYRPANVIAPKRLPLRAAPPVYRPTARPVQMTPGTWRAATEVTTVLNLAAGSFSKWPPVQAGVQAYSRIADDSDFGTRREVLNQLEAAIGRWQQKQARNLWLSKLDKQKHAAVAELLSLIGREREEIARLVPPPSRFIPTAPIRIGGPLRRGYASASSSDTPPPRPIPPPPPQVIPTTTTTTATATAPIPIGGPRRGYARASSGDGPMPIPPLPRFVPPASTTTATTTTTTTATPIGAYASSSGDGSPPRIPVSAFAEEVDNAALLRLGLRTYLHFTREAYLESIGELGLIAGHRKGIGAPGTGEADRDNVYVVSGSPGANFASAEAGGHPVVVITSASPAKDINYRGGAYMFSQRVPPMRDYRDEGTTFSFTLPPNGATKEMLAAFINRRSAAAAAAAAVSAETVWRMVRADLLIRFPAHFRGVI